MSVPLREYSEQAIGRNWTEDDHLYLVVQLEKIDALAQGVVNLSERRVREVVIVSGPGVLRGDSPGRVA